VSWGVELKMRAGISCRARYAASLQIDHSSEEEVKSVELPGKILDGGNVKTTSREVV